MGTKKEKPKVLTELNYFFNKNNRNKLLKI